MENKSNQMDHPVEIDKVVGNKMFHDSVNSKINLNALQNKENHYPS